MTSIDTDQVSAPVVAGARLSSVDGWALHEFQEVTSTNLVAAGLTPWSAVRADSQTAGRGRFQRAWVSDRGGLWLSAVLPLEGLADGHALPLAVGLAVCDVLDAAGVRGLRMRWPNDILVENRKLAGLLIDQFRPGFAVAGIGINVSNDPAATDPTLAGKVITLRDLLPCGWPSAGRTSSCPPVTTPGAETTSNFELRASDLYPIMDLRPVTAEILTCLRHTMEELRAGGFVALLPRVNRLWGSPRQVELDLDGPIRRGTFLGVDEQGRLLLAADSIPPKPDAFTPHQVRHLTEI